MPSEVRVSAEQERAYRLARHGLLPSAASAPALDALAGVTFGLHAARQSSPWVTLRTRLPGFKAAELRSMLGVERRLIKVRCMRQTLHILPLELARTAHHATLPQRLGPCMARLRRIGGSERALRSACNRVRAVLGDDPVPYRQLEADATSSPERIGLTRIAIKWLWETGELAHVDLSPSLHHEHRAFVLTERRYDGLLLCAPPADHRACCDALITEHLRAFGPASVADTAWWSGLGATAVRGAVDRAGDQFVKVAVDGIGEELLLSADQLEALRQADPLDADHVTLLAYEDPALKGYFATRSRYVSGADYELLFNTIGEARAAVMVGGLAAGIWGFDRRARRVTHTPMRRLGRRMQKLIAERLLDLEDFLRAEPLLR